MVRIVVSVLLALTIVTCTDAPVAPPGGGDGPIILAPIFSYAGVQQGTPQADALNAAFDRVNAVRVFVFTDNPRVLLLDVVIEATADDEGIEIEVEIPGVEPGQQLIVVILGLEIVDGVTTELFTTGELSVTARAVGNNDPPQVIDAVLTYTGPGAAAAAVEITGGDLVLSPEASGALGSVVLDPEGGEIANVPVVWTSANGSVASVDDEGVVTGVSDGKTEVTVTTPNGQAASTRVYVVDGMLAFVQGGQVMTANAGTEAAARGGSGARGPAWSPDGAWLFYGAGGQVHETGGGAVTDGSWPSVSPDGTKLAVEVGGRVGFTNIDGSQPTEGPEGTTPSWLNGTTLVVDGGSIQQVRADGANRTTLDGNLLARMPSVSGGQVLYVGSDNKVRQVGGGVILDLAVNSRPALSPNGQWVVGSTADGLHVGPADGSGPILPMGFPGALDPVFQPMGAAQAPPVLTLSGFLPAEPIPGQPVEILGSGFDWIIAANTGVEFPTAAGPVPAEDLEVLPDRLRTIVPRDLVAGQVTVHTLTDEASLTVDPPRFGSVEFLARTPWEAPVGGVVIALLQDGLVAGSATTGPDGMATLDGLLFGDYTLGVTPPAGFTHTGGDAAVTVGPTVAHADIEVTPVVDRIETIPAELIVEVDEVIDVELIPLDINGVVIPVVDVRRWAGASDFISWSGRDLMGIIRGLAPTSDARIPILINGQTFALQVTVPGGLVNFETAIGTGLNQSDDDCDLIPLGFTFEFYGVAYTQVWVNSNGNLTFNGCNTEWGHPDIPDGTNVLIGPLYGDFDPGDAGDVYFNTLGTAPNQRFVATWSVVPEFASVDTETNTFQAQLFEGSNGIGFAYNGLATDGINWAFSSPSLDANMDVGITSGTGSFISSASGSSIPLLDGTTLLYSPIAGPGYTV